MRTTAVLLFGMLLGTGCMGDPAKPRERPSGVPSAAAWVGGADGGVWILCEVSEEKEANYCTAYHENHGKVIAEGWFVLDDTREAAVIDELAYSGFDGYEILLEGGRRLTPLELKQGLMPGE